MLTQRVRLTTLLVLFVLLAILAPAASAQGEPTKVPAPTPNTTPAPAPTAAPWPPRWPHATYLPLLLAPAQRQPDLFWADRTSLGPGECTALHWYTTNASAVYLNSQAVAPEGTVQVCPAQSTVYQLWVKHGEGGLVYTVYIEVQPPRPSVQFWADVYSIHPGACASLHWRVNSAQAVRLAGIGVAGAGDLAVCPAEDTTYPLEVTFGPASTATWRLTIHVGQPTARFWAEQYALPENGCTTLHWKTSDAMAVYLDGEGVPGVGARMACPGAATQFYQLEVLDVSGASGLFDVVLTMGDPALAPPEVIAQAVVNSIAPVVDVNPADPGNQAGYQLELEGVRVLYAGTLGWSSSTATLAVSQALLDLGDSSGVHWPLHAGQQVEFRAACEGAACVLDYTSDNYLYMRSE